MDHAMGFAQTHVSVDKLGALIDDGAKLGNGIEPFAAQKKNFSLDVMGVHAAGHLRQHITDLSFGGFQVPADQMDACQGDLGLKDARAGRILFKGQRPVERLQRLVQATGVEVEFGQLQVKFEAFTNPSGLLFIKSEKYFLFINFTKNTT